MAKPSSLERQSYPSTSRSNSPSSVVTVRASGGPRSRSTSRNPSKASNTSSDDAKSSSKRVSSSGSSKHLEKAGAEGGHYSRWSQSSNSTHGTNEHRRHSSFSKRFSFGATQLGPPQSTTSRRTASPSKKKRPVDIQTGLSGPKSSKGTSQGEQLTVPGSLGVPKALDTSSSDGPRTPLLSMGQISSADDMRISPRHPDGPSFKRTGFQADSRSISQPTWASTGISSPPSMYTQAKAGRETNVTQTEGRKQSPARSKSKQDKEKKQTLSRALQRANEAVQLDNAQHYIGAVEAYHEACEYLTRVLSKTTGEEDKRKLSTIRTTYTSRIRELEQLDAASWSQAERWDGSGQDARVLNNRSETGQSLDGTIEHEEHPEIGTATTSDVVEEQHMRSRSSSYGETGALHQRIDSELDPTLFSSSRVSGMQSSGVTDSTKLAPPSAADMPPPLSPRRPPPPIPTGDNEAAAADESVADYDARRESHLIGTEDASYPGWLENAQHSPDGASQSSSHHSVSSLNGLRRRHLRVHSTSTEAEFDAALDAAVEAAYDEGYEPYVESEAKASRDYMARASIIEPRTRPDEFFAQRNSIVAAANARTAMSERDQRDRQSSSQFSEPISEMDSDEEERLLDEATQQSVVEEANLESQSKSNPPRQSDSSSSSGRTWGSSAASSLNTAGTSLTTVDEHASTPLPNFKQLPPVPPPAPPPTGALPSIPGAGQAPPPPPLQATRPLPTLALPQSPSVQDRRSSNQGARKLKIETAIGPKPEFMPPHSIDATLSVSKREQSDLPEPPVPPKSAPGPSTSDGGPTRGVSDSNPQGLSAPSSFRLISSPFPTPFQCQFPEEISTKMSPPTPSLTPSLTPAISNDSGSIRPSPQSASPINPFQNTRSIDRGLMQSNSSLSLRQKGVLTPESYETSPATPMSFSFGTAQTLGRTAPLNTPVAETSTPVAPPVNNVNLFANEIHASDTLSQTESRVPHPPRPLEPCPSSHLLRPFWLMRRFYQTVAHPRGGYLSNKIFIPREVWKVKNVKLKNVEDKISNCDLLTAALLKLGSVDTLDADAVLEEMQALESVLDQAAANLSKKLGNDVGVQTISSLFKDAPATSTGSPNNGENRAPGAGDTTSGGASGNASKSNSKSYLASWRKLRSKNSSANLAGTMPVARDTSNKESVTMSSIPMTTSWPGASNRNAKKDVGLGGGDVKTDGPNALYMSALARLCDAVQVLDRIARQVEDPGLKHSSPTHVGLELSSRHAAEFFGFYICRFVLQDIMMLAEKFVKRASEWVLS